MTVTNDASIARDAERARPLPLAGATWRRVGAGADAPPDAAALPRVVVAALVVAWLVVLAFRVAYVSRYRIDTDEPQHLHVIWSWVRGLVQYRDVFDNHAPLFHVLLAPLAAAVGERSDIIYCMRFAMLPLSALALWGAYAIGRATFGRVVAAWATVFGALVPGSFLASVEFRADTLWSALWLLGLGALLAGPLTARRAFVSGLLLGATLATSLKTVLLLLALAAALGVTLRAEGGARRLRALGARIGVAAIGFMLVPAMLVVFFARQGALMPMLDATVTHNVVGGVGLQRWAALRMAALVAAVPLWLWVGERTARAAADPEVGARRRVLVLTTIAYLGLLEGCWPVATRQDFQPWTPLCVILVTAVGFALLDRVPARLARALASPPAMASLGAVVVALQIWVLWVNMPPWGGRARVDPALLADVLRLTDASDTVMDLKGETVFRERPFYYALETITRERMRDGSIPDTIPEELAARGTAVAILDTWRFPPRGRAFLQDNYVPIGRLRVAGRVLAPASTTRRSLTFDVRIAAPYVLVAAGRPVRGWIDGRPADRPVFLAVGRHRLRAAPSAGALVLIWAPALERGFAPLVTKGSA